MSCVRGCTRQIPCALAMLASWLAGAVDPMRADEPGRSIVAMRLPPLDDELLHAEASGEVAWIEWNDTYEPDDWASDPATDSAVFDGYGKPWTWHWLPPNVIYHSYMAGVHEPRMALVTFFNGENHAYWDATLGGRAPLLRYGDRDPLRPQGYQLDFYGAAIVRLDAEHRQDLEACDYVFGFPITYGVGNWQFKTGYMHVSSHLGDERAIRIPGELDERINYVRDGIMFGSSYYPNPVVRVYTEADWAFHRSGGAKALDVQFGTEVATSCPTGPTGAPFLAVHGHLRQEVDWGGEMALQFGWMRRGELGQTTRLGVHYFNGKSSQYQFFNIYEQQLGVGLWYDF